VNEDSYLIGSSRHIINVRGFCGLFGPRGITVVTVGETGTGKSVVAVELHCLSARSTHPLVRIPAAELKSELIQGKLAGVVQGAFTSANKDRDGLLVTDWPIDVFLDDIQDLPLDSQGYLLDCLDGKPLRAEGGVKTFIPDVRWIIGSQESLAALVLAGKLRRDLAARCGGAEIRLLPLRHHREDVVLLAPHLLARLAAKEHLDVPAIGACAMKVLVEYDWPENVRQLESVLHYALVMASASGDKAILAKHLPAGVGNGQCRGLRQPAEALRLRQVLDANDWNITKVSAILGIARRTVQRKMKAYGIRRNG
jgi:DNA-binding NtrC family response regulator